MYRRRGSVVPVITTDTLLLSTLLDVPEGSLLFDLGCGTGGSIEAASLRNPGCSWVGIDILPEHLRALMKAGRRWTSAARVCSVCCDVRDVPGVFRSSIADGIICNPPFMREGRSRSSPHHARALARRGPDLLTGRFIRAASHLLVPGGTLVVSGRPEMLPDLMLAMGTWGIGPRILQPVGEPGRPAVHIIIEGRKGKEGGLTLRPQVRAVELLEGPE